MKSLLSKVKGYPRAMLLILGMAFLFSNFNLCATDNAQSPSSPIVLNGKSINPDNLKSASYFQKASIRSEIEGEARRLAEDGDFEKAISRYQDALHPALIEDEVNKSMALWGIMQIHQWQEKFELALEELQWFLKIRPDKDHYIDKKMELEALIKARNTQSHQPIYEFVEYMKKKWKKLIPPKGSNTYTSSVTSPIIQMYDYMGDMEGGIGFVEPIIQYHQSRGREHDYLVKEYQKVKDAFLEDKSSGTKGRATQVLIQSSYFSW